jgi:hypothetical protein
MKALYVLGIVLCAALNASLSSGISGPLARWLGAATFTVVFSFAVASGFKALRRRRGIAINIPRFAFWVALFLSGTQLLSAASRVNAAMTQDPYELVKSMRLTKASEFDRGFMSGVQHYLETTYGKEIATDLVPVQFTDLHTAMRAVVRYSAKASNHPVLANAHVLGELRTFYHRGGVAQIETTCVAQAGDCNELGRIASKAETVLLAHLDDSSLNGILPSNGECSIENADVPNSSKKIDVAMCEYGSGRIVTLARRNAAETRRALQAALRAAR